MLIYASTWWYLLKAFSAAIPYLKALQYTWVAIFMDLVIPAEAVSGDVTRIYLASKALNGKTGEILASIVIHKILTISIPLLGLIISIIAIMFETSLSPVFLNFVMLVATGACLTLAFLFLFSLNANTAEKILDKIFDLLPDFFIKRLNTISLKSKMQTFLKSFSNGIRVITKHPSVLVSTCCLAIVAWVLDLLAYYVVFVAIGVKIPLTVVVMVYSIMNAVQLIPFGTPGAIGPLEILMIGLFIPFGLSISISAAATILIRLITLWFKFIVGGAMFEWAGLQFLFKKHKK